MNDPMKTRLEGMFPEEPTDHILEVDIKGIKQQYFPQSYVDEILVQIEAMKFGNNYAMGLLREKNTKISKENREYRSLMGGLGGQ